MTVYLSCLRVFSLTYFKNESVNFLIDEVIIDDVGYDFLEFRISFGIVGLKFMREGLLKLLSLLYHTSTVDG